MPMSAQQDRIDRYVVEVGNGMRAEHDAMVDEMVEVIAQQVDHLDDGQTHATLRASVEGNVESIIHMLRNQVPAEQAQATASALAYALRLAQREISADSLRRAYHLGTEVVRRRYFEQVLALDASAEDKLHVSLQVQLFLHQYVDRVSVEVQQAYAEEARRRFERSASATATVIREVLAGAEVQAGRFERLARYRLDQQHRGAVLWVDDANPGIDSSPQLADLAAEIARRLGPRTTSLYTAVDRSMGWAWFGTPDAGEGAGEDAGEDAAARAAIAEAVEAATGVRAALGSWSSGADGFRRSHQQAEAAASVLQAGQGTRQRVIGYGDPGVAMTAILVQDLTATRAWVHDQLGGLADAGEAAQRLRDTLECFLQCESSYTRTAERMSLHRNSVTYRVEKAVEARGRPVTASATDLAAALTVCRLLGGAVTGAQ